MKRALALSLPLYLSCAAPQKTANVIVEVKSASPVSMQKITSPTEPTQTPPEEKSLEEMAEFAVKAIKGINKERNILGLSMSFPQSSISLMYRHTGLTCLLWSPQRRRQIKFLDYWLSESEGITIRMIDKPPYGSLDFVDMEITDATFTRRRSYYSPFFEAQELYRVMQRTLYHQLKPYYEKKKNWKSFNPELKGSNREELQNAGDNFLKRLPSQKPLLQKDYCE